jgi:hypothetical protein
VLIGRHIHVMEQSRTSCSTKETKYFDDIPDSRSIYRPELGDHHAGSECRP